MADYDRNWMIRDNILAVLDSFELDNPEEICKDIAKDFRRHRVEKALTQKNISEKSGVPLASVRRFEKPGQVS